MGSQNSKVQYIMLPGQSGKTRKVEELIRRYGEMSRITNDCEENDINIIFCSNNRALVKQTESRMYHNLFEGLGCSDDSSSLSSLSAEEDSSDAIIENRVFSWFSGKNVKKISKEQIVLDILHDNISMMICCANKIRMKYVYDIVKRLQDSRFFTRKIYLWLDEGDAYVNLWRDPSINVTLFSKVARVTPVSATFDSCIKNFVRLKILPFECTTNLETYHQFQDCNIITDDTDGSAPEYFSAILEKNYHQICKPGVRLFCPGDNKTVTHDDIALEALLNGFVVAIINGKQKALLFPDGRAPLPLLEDWDENEAPEEIGMKIGRLYRDLNLAEFPFAITGHTCLSRGITFQNELFMFDFGIIPKICNAATAYQTSCRMNGNIRKYSGYKAPTVFMCSRMQDKVIQNEEIAKNIARICHEEGLEDVGQEDFDKAAGVSVSEDPQKRRKISKTEEHKWDIDERDFETIDEANAFLKENNCNGKYTFNRDVNGFILSSTTGKRGVLSYGTVKAEVSNWNKLSGFDTRPKSSSAGRMIIAYRDTQDINTVVFIVRIIKKKAEFV
jgi:hypothetical protein